MEMEIDEASSEPVYEQIVRQILLGVQQGLLPPNTPLPPIRQLARDLDLNHNTVAKAYKILEGRRVIRTAGQKGTFIHSDAQGHITSSNNTQALYLMRDAVTSLRGKGLSDVQIEAAFRAALASQHV